VYKLLWGCGIGTLSTALTLTTAQRAQAFAFIFAQEGAEDRVTHQIGYRGVSGDLQISVGIDPTSTFASDMLISTQNVINTWNSLVPTTGNLQNGLIANNEIDFESVLLHELGHSLGLAHPNAASESGLPDSQRNYTKATEGTNNAFDLNPGADGIIGSADDIRGDDVNLNYFRRVDNDPFATNLGVVDSTTYSRDIADLPIGDTFSANSDRAVAAALGYSNTESVMQQGTFFGEVQRDLTADDVAGILYSQAGLDELAGTNDDYTFTLEFLGLDAAADIVIDFDNSETGFAVSSSRGSFLSSNHLAITSSSIFFNTGFNWYFNDTLNTGVDTGTGTGVDTGIGTGTGTEPVPEPLTIGGTLLALGLGWKMRRTQHQA
jgi:hypothetical protein